MESALTEKKSLLSANGVEVVRESQVFENLADVYGVSASEIRYIDFNRTGVYLPNNKIPVDFRARFKTEVTSSGIPRETYFALPVRCREDSNYSIWADNTLRFNDDAFGIIEKVELDTCDTSYTRGPGLINLNSRRRGNCRGCKTCVHNYEDLYDGRVLKDNKSLISREDISDFFHQKEVEGVKISELNQIAVVTGLFGSEQEVINHMDLINKVVGEKGFDGELLYFGCEVNSKEALQRLADLGNFTLIYAIDVFANRDSVLAESKNKLSLENANETLGKAKSLGINSTYAYIIGVDSLDIVEMETKKLNDSITQFPVINIYQVQHPQQVEVMPEEAKSLEYYIQARQTLENVFEDGGLKPKPWENYRPLWYDSIYGKLLIP